MLSEAQKAQRREYYAKNKAAFAARMRAYHLKNREVILEQKRKWYATHREENRAKCKIWASKNTKHLREYHKKWRLQNRDRISFRQSKIAATERYLAKPENQFKIRTRVATYLRRRYKDDANFRVMRILRSRLNKILRTKGIAKSTKSFDLIGCTPDFANGYLEGQFTSGMTWNNVHIDHHIPCAAFDLTDPEQQKQCFNYSNLKPLLAQDNLKKGRQIPAHS